MELRLAAPAVPEHLFRRNHFSYAHLTRRPYAAPDWLALDPADTHFPWATLVHGLETDTPNLRDRFVTSLRRAIAQERPFDDLADAFGRPLGAAFRRLYGGRGENGHTPGFRAWALALSHDPAPLVARIAAFGLLGSDDPRATARLRQLELPAQIMVAHQEKLELEQELREAQARPTEQDEPGAHLGALHELERYLDELGFSPTPGATPRRARDPRALGPRDARACLLQRGRALVLDSETGHLPVDHDELLYWIADLVPALGDVVFDQKPPRDLEDPGARYRLHAYADGVRRRTHARNLGDFYDVPSCVGLVNALLFLRRSDERVVMLDGESEEGWLVAGPRRALRELRVDGFLSFDQAEE